MGERDPLRVTATGDEAALRRRRTTSRRRIAGGVPRSPREGGCALGEGHQGGAYQGGIAGRELSPAYSALMPRSLMTRAHFFCSLSKCAAASSGVLAMTVTPRSS